MSTFDAENFEFMEIQGANSTQRVPVPQYPDGVIATVKEVIKARPLNIVDKNTGAQETRYVCGLVWAIDDDKAKEVTGLPNPTVRQDMWLDITPQGGLDMGKGKNVDLGRTREAVGLNDPSKPFKFSMFLGQVAKLVITHREDKDKGEVYAQVKKVLPRNHQPS